MSVTASVMDQERTTAAGQDTGVPPQSLRQAVHAALELYFRDLDGFQPDDLYRMVLQEVEPPLLERVMHHARGNQSKAAEMLGINRGTLRKKLRLYGLDR